MEDFDDKNRSPWLYLMIVIGIIAVLTMAGLVMYAPMLLWRSQKMDFESRPPVSLSRSFPRQVLHRGMDKRRAPSPLKFKQLTVKDIPADTVADHASARSCNGITGPAQCQSEIDQGGLVHVDFNCNTGKCEF